MSKKNNPKTILSTFNECFLTGIVFDGQFSPLRLSINDNLLCLDLTDKTVDNSILIDPSPKLINAIITGQRLLPKDFQSLIGNDFKDKIIELYDKKIYSSLGFLLKSGQAIIGRRAIDRALTEHNDKNPFALLLTEEGSVAICKSFQFKKPSLKIIENFSQNLLIEITGRKKISYYCILNTQMGIYFFNDYMKYQKIINM